MAGRKSTSVSDVWTARTQARRRLPRMMFDFVDGATGQEIASDLNLVSLQSIKLMPRALVDVEELDLSATILGQSYSRPFGFAPMGMCNLISPSADRAMCHEARMRNLPCAVSTAASTPLEDTWRMSEGRTWFQLYADSQSLQPDGLVGRARDAGYQTLVFTVDTPRLSRRIRDETNGFRVPFRPGPRQILDFVLHPRWSLSMLAAGAPKPMNFETPGGKNGFDRTLSRGGVDWRYLDQLRRQWTGKLVIKGIISADDAVRAKSAGADAVYVSNHGGRQLDSAPAAINALPSIRKAVGEIYPLIFDSGIRSADDIVRALALGASFVMLGRPVLYALGAGGPEGLSAFLDCLEEDLRSVMAQIGATSIGQIDHTRLAHKDGACND